MASQTLLCILCQQNIPEKTKPEHVLLNALGGRLTVKNVICPACNHRMGIGPDNDLANSVEPIRNICNLHAGDNDPPPTIKRREIDGERYDLRPGMHVVPNAKKPLDLEISENEINVRINAGSDEQVEKLLEGAAISIAKKLGITDPKIIEAIKKDLQKDQKSHFAPAPTINQHFEFGTGASQQSIAKACLILWARKFGNDEVNHHRYDAIRHFIETGEKGDGNPEDTTKIDVRILPALPEKYSSNPNIVWAGSNQEGKVFGYFRLYGAFGWRVNLCDYGAPPSAAQCLISNPINNKVWDVLADENSPLKTEWVFDEWQSRPLIFDNVIKSLSPLFDYAHENATDMMLKRGLYDGLTRAGCKEGDTITKEHAKVASDYVGRMIAAYLLKTRIPDKS